MTRTIHWLVTDLEARACESAGGAAPRTLGLVRHCEADSLFYEAVIDGVVACTTNLPFEAMAAVEQALGQASASPPTLNHDMSVRAAAERLLAARADQTVTADEWDALERALNACNDGGSASA